MHDPRRRPPADADATVRQNPLGEAESREALRAPATRRLRTQNDITSALDAPPVEDLTRPEVHLPVDVPPDDLTEMHEVYSSSEGDAASLPHEAPFGAHIEPDASELDHMTSTPPTRASASPLPDQGARPAPGFSSVTRVRTRTIAVEEDLSSSWSMPLHATPSGSVVDATGSTPPSVVISPSFAPPEASPSWVPAAPPHWPPAIEMPRGPTLPPPSTPRGQYGTVEMNLQMRHGVPTPAPLGPQPNTPRAPSARPANPAKVGGLIWLLVALALTACVAMMVYARLRA